MNDCLRHIDFALGSPANTLVVSGRYAAKSVLHHQLRQGTSWKDYVAAWWDYWGVLWRIQIHEVGAWWLQRRMGM